MGLAAQTWIVKVAEGDEVRVTALWLDEVSGRLKFLGETNRRHSAIVGFNSDQWISYRLLTPEEASQ